MQKKKTWVFVVVVVCHFEMKLISVRSPIALSNLTISHQGSGLLFVASSQGLLSSGVF